jgi:hypothetical protein
MTACIAPKAKPGELVHRILHIGESWPQPHKELLSGLGWGNAARRSREQTHSYVFFQAANRVTHGRR